MYDNIYLRAKEILKEKGWAQGSAVNITNNSGPVCLGLAVLEAFTEIKGYDPRKVGAIEPYPYIWENLQITTGEKDPTVWNDEIAQSVDEVYEVLDKAIAL